MDDQLLTVLCDHLKPLLYTEGGCIVREGDPVNQMFFIMRGNLVSITTNGGKTGFFSSDVLRGGDYCGDELITWALDPNSTTSSLPRSTTTVKSMSGVEAFALKAGDLKVVVTRFRQLHSKQMLSTYRFYSQQWRTWAACFIQAAWHRYCRNMIEYTLREEELLQLAIVNDGYTLLSSGVEINDSRYARKMMRILEERVPAKLLEKPAEPNFSAEEQ
jgi:cyclic nucleotide gated channel